MVNWETLRKHLEENGFAVSFFTDAQQACDYLDQKLDGKTVGHGGSMTLQEIGLLDRLAGHATLYRHQPGGASAEAATAQVYLCSVNGLAETGEIINIDGTGNRVASTTWWWVKTRSPQTTTPLCGAPATLPRPGMPSGWAARLPVQPRLTNVTIAAVPSASAAPW